MWYSILGSKISKISKTISDLCHHSKSVDTQTYFNTFKILCLVSTKSQFKSVFSWFFFLTVNEWSLSVYSAPQKLYKSFVIWYKTTYIRSDTCTFTYKPEWHTNTSASCLWIQLARSLSLSHTQTSPQHHYQSSECSMAGTPHRQSEWSQQTCRSLLLRSAKTPLL